MIWENFWKPGGRWICLTLKGKVKRTKLGQIGKNKLKNKFVFPIMVKNNICCFGGIIGKTDLCNEMSFSKVAILAIFRFAGLGYEE